MGVGAVRTRGKGFLVGTAVILLAYLVVARVFGGGQLPEAFAQKPSLEAALERARASGKPVLALASAEWCGPCRKLEAGPLRDGDVEKWVSQNTEPAFLDFTTANGELGERYHIYSLPTLLLLRDGKEVGRLEGYAGAEKVLTWLQALSGPLEDWKAAHPGQEAPSGYGEARTKEFSGAPVKLGPGGR
ncbi:MAG: thioredoxin fold domain-containing protein [Tepidisphaera sp.]|nr:thioredoxin fold domain-containing protein [Tepidisphaera sp.]